ncbi:S-adenosyl-L-methionine-dependent methyltransferase [Fusarium oxysporum f. sp. albedinis]|nr:S-adenosyl-L-methionine-dependent methyltransferase [Fusarium oxysporum f. sp. albedinis]
MNIIRSYGLRELAGANPLGLLLLELFDLGMLQKLGQEPQSSEQLTAGTKADLVLVSRAPKYIAANGIIKEVGRGSYVGTQFLCQPEQVPLDANHSPVQYGLRTDKPFFSILRDNARLGKGFNSFMAGYAKARPQWTEVYPYKERLGEDTDASAPWLVDVGGGLGHELLGLALENVPGRLVLQDLSAVIEEAKSSAECKGAKTYFMRLILRDWPDAECATILSHLRDAMAKDYSRLLINETILRDVGAPWQLTSLDWTMMGMLVNRERAESQWRQILNDAGLKIIKIYYKGIKSVIEAALA